MVIGFFAPLPLALMIPFMAGQSLAMGEAFGKGFQFGKRKISAMDNKEFNNLTFKGLAEQIATDYTQLIPTLQQSINESKAFQRDIIVALAEMLKNIPNDILKGLFGIEPFSLENFGQPNRTLPEDEDTAKEPSGLLNITLREAQLLSLNTLQQRVNNIQAYNPTSQNILTQELQRRNRNLPTPIPPKEFPTSSIYRVPTQSFINKIQVAAWNRMLKDKKHRDFALSTAKYYANTVRQLANPRLNPNSPQHKTWTGQQKEILKIISDFNKSIGA